MVWLTTGVYILQNTMVVGGGMAAGEKNENCEFGGKKCKRREKGKRKRKKEKAAKTHI